MHTGERKESQSEKKKNKKKKKAKYITKQEGVLPGTTTLLLGITF